MNRPRCTDTDYVDFLVATPRAVSGTEAARVQPRRPDAPAHDAFTRLLHRLEPDPATLWHEVAPLIERGRGVLIVDDTTLDKPYAKKIELVHRHWSGKHHAVVDGINLITLVWSEGESLIPCDWRVFDKPNDGMTKNDHFGAMVLTAGQRGFTPECVLFDSWYASIDNLRLIRNRDWRWLTQLRSNRLVNPDRTGNRAVRDCMIAETGTVVHLKDYGMVKVFRIVTPAGDTEYWATNDLEMDEGERLKYAEFAWGIEVYHRALKQECGVERAMVRAARAQRNHIGCAIRAFVRLEWHRLRTGIGWKLAKEGIIRAALRRYLAHPWYILPASA
jgi:putative transposase